MMATSIRSRLPPLASRHEADIDEYENTIPEHRTEPLEYHGNSCCHACPPTTGISTAPTFGDNKALLPTMGKAAVFPRREKIMTRGRRNGESRVTSTAIYVSWWWRLSIIMTLIYCAVWLFSLFIPAGHDIHSTILTPFFYESHDPLSIHWAIRHPPPPIPRPPPQSLPRIKHWNTTCHSILERSERWAAFYVQYLERMEHTLQQTSCRRNPKINGTINLGADYCSTKVPAVGNYTYFNPLLANRYMCGYQINSRTLQFFSHYCPKLPSYFPAITTTSESLTPIKLRFGEEPVTNYETFPCDLPVPCWDGGKYRIYGTRFVDANRLGEDIPILHSMEGAAYYPLNSAKSKTQYYSTVAMNSDIPVPYFSFDEYNLEYSAPVQFDRAIRGASFLARNCNSMNDRESLVRALIDSPFRVDSLSSCLRNAQPPVGANIKNKTDILRRYLFHFAFENQCNDDYITEKLWGALASGTLPVYYGAPNVREYVPNHSIIVVNDFDTPQALAEHLIQVSNDRARYESYHAWRTKPLPEHMIAKYNFTHVHSVCRTCRWAYATMYGLGWDHTQQQVRDVVMSREPVFESLTGLLQHPLKESYSLACMGTSHGPDPTVEIQPIERQSFFSQHEQMISVANVLKRSVRYHDKVIDITIQIIDTVDLHVRSNFALRLEAIFPLKEPGVVYDMVVSSEKIGAEGGHVRLQGFRTRITILSWPRLNMLLIPGKEPLNAVVEIPLSKALPLRIRIFTEDQNWRLQGASDDEGFFGAYMIRDFFNPVEVFHEAKKN